jgi:3-isopropylmalate/(R)-2-methylmalate dehydratase large subunit
LEGISRNEVHREAPSPGAPRTLAQKIWDAHLVPRAARATGAAVPDLLYVDLHLVHELSPQAFDGLRVAGRPVRRPDLTLAIEDHNVPTKELRLSILDAVARAQVEALRRNCAEFGIPLFRMGDREQGIVHVVGPELGLTQPGMVVVCGDSHTSTHGALGAFAFGVGTSEVEHVLATQTLPMQPFRTMSVTLRSRDGRLSPGVTAKDLALALIAKIGTTGGQGHVIEYRGNVVRGLSIEGRMTLCNMSIEAGARAGLVAPDDATFAYLRGRPRAPQAAQWDEAIVAWSTLHTDEGAHYDREVSLDIDALTPYVTWGTDPSQAVPMSEEVPDPAVFATVGERTAAQHALRYMDLEPGTRMRDIRVDTVFVGSCTNGRLEDLRAAADVLRGRRVREGLRMLVVPGSMRVKRQAEDEGLDQVFLEAGAEWRASGCSMCVGLGVDLLAPGERCASTSNRNFEGRQGKGGRTHLVSPVVAAATAVRGSLSTPDDLD